MKLRLTLAGIEVVAFIFGLVALLEFGWKVPQTAPFWQTIGYIFAFIGIAVAWDAVVLFTLLGGKRGLPARRKDGEITR